MNKPDYAFERRAGSWKVTTHERVQLELPIFSFENFLKFLHRDRWTAVNEILF